MVVVVIMIVPMVVFVIMGILRAGCPSVISYEANTKYTRYHGRHETDDRPDYGDDESKEGIGDKYRIGSGFPAP